MVYGSHLWCSGSDWHRNSNTTRSLQLFKEIKQRLLPRVLKMIYSLDYLFQRSSSLENKSCLWVIQFVEYSTVPRDEFDHEAWNNSHEDRVVLFVDFIRPLSFPVSLFNRVLIKLIAWSPFVRENLKKYLRWEQGFRKIIER